MAARLALLSANLPEYKQRKERIYRFRDPELYNLTDNEMRIRNRFGKQSFAYLVQLLDEDLCRGTPKKTSVSVQNQLAIALRFYASGSFLQVIGDTLGFNKSTVSRVVESVTKTIISKVDQFIKWQITQQMVHLNKVGFHGISGFPHVVGCIDGTHIRIQAPTEDEASYVNRRGYHSINVQTVCDYEGKFTQITANWPGSTHDSHIFRTSNLCQHLEQNNRVLTDGILLGDSGYGCRPFLLTPHPNPQAEHQERFNRSHTSTRAIIERTFGVWKRRFHVLHSEIKMKPDKVCRIVCACAILHNIAVIRKEPLTDDGMLDVNVADQTVNYNGPQDGKHVREFIARTFFSQ